MIGNHHQEIEMIEKMDGRKGREGGGKSGVKAQQEGELADSVHLAIHLAIHKERERERVCVERERERERERMGGIVKR
jgi:hypothetical protein